VVHAHIGLDWMGTLTLRADRQSARMSKITNDVRLNPVWHRMLYSCAHMATVGMNWKG